MANEDPNVHPPMILTTSTAGKKPRLETTSENSLSTDTAQKPIQLQRRRVWRACESCRRKKIKCDGHEPTCGQCVAARLQCQWSQTKDRAALSRHYVQELEARLIQMENLLNQMNAEKGKTAESSPPGTSTSTLSHPPFIIPTKLSSPVASSTASPSLESDKIKREEPEAIMSEQFGQLALDEHGHGRWLGTSSTISLISSFRALTSAGPDRYSPASPSDDGLALPSMSSLYFPGAVMFGKSTALPSVEEVLFPDSEIADLLVDAYFARYHFLVPILDKPSFLQGYRLLKEQVDSRSDPAFLSVVFAVFACASRLVDDPRLAESGRRSDDETGMIYYEKALILHYIGHAQIQIAHVQCFALLASFLCSANCLPQAWLLVGQALRTAQDLGLHRSPRRLNISPVEKETRRKVWWNVYCLDRMLAVALGRPMGIDDIDCDVELPVDLDDEELPIYFSGAQINRAAPSLMTGFVALVGLYTIAGRLLRQVYALRFCREDIEPDVMAELQASVDDLDRQLDDWCEVLPTCFKSQPVNEQQVSMGAVLCSSWYAVRITLHRNFLPIKRNSQPPPGSTSAAKAVSAARSCIFLASSIKSVIPPSHHLAFFIQYLFSSAVIILLCAIHTTDDSAAQAMREAQNCLNALAELEGIWPGAKKCKELLSELSIATRVTMQNEAAKKNSPPVAPLHPPMVHPSPPASRHVVIPPGSGGVNLHEFSRPSHRTAKSKHAAHSKRRSMSQKRPRDESESPGDFSGLSSTPPDRDRSIRSMHRNSIANRSPSVARRAAVGSTNALNVPTPVLVENSMPEQSSQVRGAHTGTSSYEGPISSTSGLPTDNTYLPDNSWSYGQEADWNTASPHVNPSGMAAEEYEVKYPLMSQYTMFDAQGDAVDPGRLHYQDMPGHNGSTMINPFDSEGLPFAGLDFLHSYNPNGSDLGSLEWWNNLGPSAFDYGPEVPFAVGEGHGGIGD